MILGCIALFTCRSRFYFTFNLFLFFEYLLFKSTAFSQWLKYNNFFDAVNAVKNVNKWSLSNLYVHDMTKLLIVTILTIVLSSNHGSCIT